jgi:hypothetical protein
MRMPLLLSVSRLLLDGSAFALRRAARSCVRRLVLGLSAYLAALGAVGFLGAALHGAMAAAWGPVPASLIMGGLLGIAALALYLSAVPRRPRRGGVPRRW